MDDAPRTHRDTLAFGLTVAGAATWALIPVMAVLRDQTDPADLVLVVSLLVGALIGAWAAATTLRRVALITGGVAGGVAAALALGATGYLEQEVVPAVGLTELAAVAGVALAAIVGTAAGRRTRGAWPALATACAGLGVLGLAGLVIGIVATVGSGVSSGVGITILLVVAVPGAAGAALLWPAAQPRPVAGWLFTLASSDFAVVAVADRDHADTGAFVLGAVVLSVGLAGFGALVTWVVRRLERPARADAAVPAAQVVAR